MSDKLGILEKLESVGLVIVQKSEILEMHCQKSYGFEGPETFPDCGKCVVCRVKEGKL